MKKKTAPPDVSRHKKNLPPSGTANEEIIYGSVHVSLFTRIAKSTTGPYLAHIPYFKKNVIFTIKGKKHSVLFQIMYI